MSRRRYAPAQARYDNIPATVRADKQGFAKTGLTSADVHIAEVHDFFTGIELLSYADLGFADRFEADKLVESEVISVGGSRVNPSGGLKSRGHPPEATGVAQCLELFEQQRLSSSSSSAATPAPRSTVHELRWLTASVARVRCRR